MEQEAMNEELNTTDFGEVLELTADENNPIGDGLEYEESED